jgi:hypothetical protein
MCADFYASPSLKLEASRKIVSIPLALPSADKAGEASLINP